MATKSKDRVYVFGPGAVPYRELFASHGFRGALSVDTADIVCFTGGEDVTPIRYGEPALPGTGYSEDRDARDEAVYLASQGKFRVGICRGGQFLNVLNGGRMWQDVTGHGLGGNHTVVDTETGLLVQCTSTHHQMMIPTPEAKVLGVAHEAGFKESFHRDWLRAIHKPGDVYWDDVEVVWYPETRSLCFQPHPELDRALKECRDWFFDLIDRCY